MNNKLKLKDIVLIALLTAIYLLIYFGAMMLAAPLGQLGHSISPGICSLLSGAVLIFMNRKVGKMWEYTIFTLLVMGAFALMGGGYLPWLITSVTGAVISDSFASRSNKSSILKISLASGIMHVGQAWGSIIPATFFVDSFRSHWIERGMTPAEMEEHIRFSRGIMGIMSTVISFVLAVAGVYIGYLILKKHLEKVKD